MRFDEVNKVIINTMDTSEAKAFVKFLQSEIARHQMDIDEASWLIRGVCLKFKITNPLDK